MNEEFYSIGRGSLNINGKFYCGLDYQITDFMRSLEEENQQLKEQLQQKQDIIIKVKDKIKKFLCSEYYCSQGLELHNFCVNLEELLDNKGDENDG